MSESSPSLRGAQVASPSKKLPQWVLLCLAVLLVGTSIALFATAIGTSARVTRMKNQGIAVTATISYCRGNLGGSGSNEASYTCAASYHLLGHNYVSVVGGLSHFMSSGTAVSVVADPEDHAAIETTTATQNVQNGSSLYFAPITVLVAGGACLALALVAKRRAKDKYGDLQ